MARVRNELRTSDYIVNIFHSCEWSYLSVIDLFLCLVLV